MSYHHLRTFDRARIQPLNSVGYSTRKIGTELGRHHSSIINKNNLAKMLSYFYVHPMTKSL